MLQTATVETTGAGDTFCACVLNYILEHGWKPYTKEELEEMLSFANAAASIVHYAYEKSGEVAANMLMEILTTGETDFKEIMLGYYIVDRAN